MVFFFLHSFLNGIFGIFSCVTKFLTLFSISNTAVQPTEVLLVYLVSLSVDHLLILFLSSLQLWEVMEENILWLNLHHTHDFFIYFCGTHFLPMKFGRGIEFASLIFNCL